MSLRPNSRSAVRRSQYKVAVGVEEGRRRREENMLEIRKNKREENLVKKRRDGVQAQQIQLAVDVPPLVDTKKWKLELESLPAMVSCVWSDDVGMQLEAITYFRKVLSMERNPERNPLILKVIESGVVPRFVHFLTRDDNPKLQFEAAWAITNIASGTSEDTKLVIDKGVVPHLVRLLSSPDSDVREQAVWALGNVAGDSALCRDIVLCYGAMVPLLAQFNDQAKPSMMRNAAWTLSNFIRKKPPPIFEMIKPALPVLAHLIHNKDEEVLADACWALSYLTEGSNEKVQIIIDANMCPRLVQLLLHPSPSIMLPALRTIGNLVTGDDAQTQVIIDNMALPCLLTLLTPSHIKSVQKEACWAISNIAAGNTDQIQAVIAAGIIPSLIYLLKNAVFEIKQEAAWAIWNVTCGGNNDQIKYLVSAGCIKPMCDLLGCPDPKTILVCLDGLYNILKIGEIEKNQGNIGHVNLFAQMIDDADGLEKVESLQSHESLDIYEKAVKILTTFWSDIDDEYLDVSGFNFGDGELPIMSEDFKFGEGT